MQIKDEWLLKDEEIDSLRLQVTDDMDKTADYNWWDICAAFEKMHGVDASITAEQYLIEIINNTGAKVAKAQLSKAAPLIAQEAINIIKDIEYLPLDEYCKKYQTSREDYFKFEMWELVQHSLVSGEGK